MLAGRQIKSSVLLALAASIASPVMADVKAGVDAWTRGDFAGAVSEWQGPASKGDVDAQFNLGQAHKLGRGVKQDLGKAEELFRKAAAKGHMQASDNYGLLLFQRGERVKAMPYISTAAERGDPRAQYLLAIASFNGDNVPKDWVRAYALATLAQQAGLPMAAEALQQMDQHIPLEQRQQSVALAQQMAAQAEATRGRQLAAVDLGTETPASAPPAAPSAPVVTAAPVPSVPVAVNSGAYDAGQAGADYARPARPVVAAVPPPLPPIAPRQPVAAVAPRPVAPRPATAASSGPWRVQIGAFGVAANADAMWDRVRNRPEVAGHGKLLVPVGNITKLMIGGFATEDAARAACARLSAGGFSCLALRN